MRTEELLSEVKMNVDKKCILCEKGILKHMAEGMYRCPECGEWFKGREEEVDIFLRHFKKKKNKIIRKG